MIAHKIFKVIIGIVLVSTLFLTSAMPIFASSPVPTSYNPENLNPLDYPFYVQASIAQSSNGSFSFVPIIPYRDGNEFYLPNFPYQRNVQFTFTFSDFTILTSDGTIGYYRPDSSPGAVPTSAPNGADTDSTLPIHIDSISIRVTAYESYNTGGGDSFVPFDEVFENGSNGVTQVILSNTGGTSFISRFTERPTNPFVFEWFSLDGGIDGVERLILNFRFSGYPSSGYFAPNIKFVFDEFIINGVEIAQEQIITEANNEMASIFQRLSDYSLEHLTEVDLSDILNNVDNASNSVEDVRFLSIFDGIYGYGIIPTLITLSLCISFVGYLLFGKSG